MSCRLTSGIPQPLPILQDSEPPHLFIDFPSDGQTLATSNTVVAGRVGDMLSGFRGLGVYVRSSPSEDGNPNIPIIAAGVQFAAVFKDPPPTGSPYVFNGQPASVNVGIGNNVIEATFDGNPGLPARFTLYAVARDPAKPTSLTGLVLDNTSQPIGNALCEIFVAPDFSNPVLATYTDTQGRFVFPNTPSGPVDLSVFGSFATTLGTNNIPPNSFPFLSYSMVLIPNAGELAPEAGAAAASQPEQPSPLLRHQRSSPYLRGDGRLEDDDQGGLDAQGGRLSGDAAEPGLGLGGYVLGGGMGYRRSRSGSMRVEAGRRLSGVRTGMELTARM